MAVSKTLTINNVRYFGAYETKVLKTYSSIQPIGVDTEAYFDGKCFMIATSEGDVFKMADFPRCFFSRKYIGKSFVAFNLKYDEGAFLQVLPPEQLRELWEEGKTEYDGFRYKSIPRKVLTISRKKHSIHFYDIWQFFNCSLDSAARRYLNDCKDDIETKTFYSDYVLKNWDRIAAYCVQDAVLVERLALFLIKTFEKFKIFPKKLYSTAYISYTYFRQETDYVTVKDVWYKNRKVLDYAMRAYKGGKFEVTRKGVDYYYEYDLISAYPFEIANLIDITNARYVYGNKYRRFAVYGFLDVTLKIPYALPSPAAVKRNQVNTYPAGEIRTFITKQEYEYFIENGADVFIHDAVWIHVDKKKYPYKKQIERLVKLKQEYKAEKDGLEYHTVKILMNSLYGKFVQLIKCKEYFKATSCWNPIYGAVITANTRIRISDAQRQYPSVVAVHTDSVISTQPLDIIGQGNLGEYSYEGQGYGVIIGSGIYQIGHKSRFRGFHSKLPLLSLIGEKKNTITIGDTHAVTWREVAFHNWSEDLINRFVDSKKVVRVNFDSKRIWLKDYAKFSEVPTRHVHSTPLYGVNGRIVF